MEIGNLNYEKFQMRLCRLLDIIDFKLGLKKNRSLEN